MITSPNWEYHGFPPEEREEVTGEKEAEAVDPRDLNSDGRMVMDLWMDRWGSGMNSARQMSCKGDLPILGEPLTDAVSKSKRVSLKCANILDFTFIPGSKVKRVYKLA